MSFFVEIFARFNNRSARQKVVSSLKGASTLDVCPRPSPKRSHDANLNRVEWQRFKELGEPEFATAVSPLFDKGRELVVVPQTLDRVD